MGRRLPLLFALCLVLLSPRAYGDEPFNVAVTPDKLAFLLTQLYGPGGLIVDSLAVLPSGDTHSAHFNSRFQSDFTQFNTALALSPSFSAAHYYTGLAYWRMGNAPQAANEFQRAVETDPSRAQTHYWLGLALEKVGKPAEARAALQQALAIDPSLVLAQQALQRLSP